MQNELKKKIKELYNEIHHGDQRDRVFFELLYLEAVKELKALEGREYEI